MILVVMIELKKKKKKVCVKSLTVQPLSVTLLRMLFHHNLTFGASGTGILRFVHEMFP